MPREIEIELHQKQEIELHKRLVGCYYYRYSFAFSRLFQRYWNQELIEMLPVDKTVRVLDLGCGIGLLSADLARNFEFVIGLDISIDMLRRLKLGNNCIKGLVNASGNMLPFLQNTFDVVICRGSLHHIRVLDKTLQEIWRVLRTGGLLVLSEPSNDCVLIRLVRRIMYKISKGFNEEDRGFQTKELRSILTNNNFDILEKKRFGFFSYLFCGFPDHFGLMRYVPFNVKLSAVFKKIDMFLSKMPFVKNQSFHIIVKAKKENRDSVFKELN